MGSGKWEVRSRKTEAVRRTSLFESPHTSQFLHTTKPTAANFAAKLGGTLPAHEVRVPRPWDLFERTALFATEICRFCETLPTKPEAQEVASQLRRAARGVASNYRAARRGRSDEEFISKIGTVIEEADESMYWLQHLAATAIRSAIDLEPLRQEANELVALFTAAHKTAKANLEAKKRRKRRRGRTSAAREE